MVGLRVCNVLKVGAVQGKDAVAFARLQHLCPQRRVRDDGLWTPTINVIPRRLSRISRMHRCGTMSNA